MEGSFNVGAQTFVFEQEVYSNKCSEDLVFNYLYMQSPCNSPIEDYTDTIYMIDRGDIPSVEYKMILRGLNV
jgi:hypothetical protein